MGQRGSRRLAGIGATSVRTQSLEQPVTCGAGVESSSKPGGSGAYACQRLSFGPSGKARWGQAKVANRTREIRPSGMKTGARGNVAMVELGSHPATERAGVVTSTYRCARPGSIQTGAADKATVQQV